MTSWNATIEDSWVVLDKPLTFEPGTKFEKKVDRFLVFRNGEPDSVKTPRDVVAALYDAHQVHIGFKDGDEIRYNGEVLATVNGPHVLPV